MQGNFPELIGQNRITDKNKKGFYSCAEIDRQNRATFISSLFRHVAAGEGFSVCIKDGKNIDPPYNTGSAFEYYDDGLEHSEWLQMIYPRIRSLYDLLSDDGFFCCHIDDSESHYLKCMCDRVFGRNNYLVSFYVQVRYPNKTLAEDSDYQKVIEQVLVYAKDIDTKPNQSTNRRICN